MAKKKGLQLVAKFNLLTLALILATSLSIGAFVIHNELQDNYEQLVRHGASIAAMTAQNGEYALYTENQDALQRLVESVSVQPEVVSVRILNQEQSALAEKPTPSLLSIPSSLPYAPVSPGQPVLFADFFADTDGAPYTVILAPVLTDGKSAGTELFLTLEHPKSAQTIGYIQLALSHQGLIARKWEFLVSIGAFTSLLLLVGITITIMMTRRLAAPIRALARLTQEISRGKLDQHIQVTTRDELGDLATAFNWMIKRLQDYRREVASAQHTLEARVRQRTIALQKTTEHAYALAHQAEAASRAKSQFLANITHEIRTPVHGVLGMMELLQTTALDGKQRRFAETAYRSGQNLLSLINDVLDFSKIEAGKLDLELLDFDLGALVEQTIDMLAEHAHRKGIRLASTIAADAPLALRGDPTRLRQILTNLLANAIKFTERGEVRVTVKPTLGDRPPTASQAVSDTGRPSPASCLLTFEVQDTGIGIPADVQERLFQPFTQADESMTRKYGGTGLGLAIAKQLVQMMNGEIGVHSAPGVGSTFWFTARLERRPTATVLPPLPENAAALLGDRAVPFVARVLLAEDNVVNQEVARSMLESLGCRVDVVTTGYAVLAALTRASYDMIFMDCQMPDLDGFATTQRIRAREQTGLANDDGASPGLPSSLRARIPIIALTANATDEDQVRCLTVGMDEYLSKPFTQEQLRALLLHWLSFSPTMRQAMDGESGKSAARFDTSDKQIVTHAVSAAPPAATTALDAAALENICALQRPGAPDLLTTVIQHYLALAPQLLQALREAIPRGDHLAIRHAAHSLKSSSANLGALTVATLCKELELMGQQQRLDAAAQALTALETAYEAARAALVVEQKKRSP
jgi:signal transduction histidine kinase/DNA-binding NarL/FixJ family response regulator/HPt (histidine-containing phosphotransfer) domain-containing protein